MKVKDLIRRLQGVDPELDIEFEALVAAVAADTVYYSAHNMTEPLFIIDKDVNLLTFYLSITKKGA